MITNMMRHICDAGSRLLSPHWWIDKTLDHIEKLSVLLLPDTVQNTPYREAPVEARVKQFGR